MKRLLYFHLTGSAHQYPDTTAPLPVPHMMALVMSQLQPVLQAFNHSLEHLSHQVGTLVKDVAELKHRAELGAELEARVRGEGEVLSDGLKKVLTQVRDVQLQVDQQRSHLEERLHSQHAMLHYNLTTFKTDVDMKIKRQQKMLQVRKGVGCRGSFSIPGITSTDLLTSHAVQPGGHQHHPGRTEARPGPG